jgi:hypothetical protein
MWQAAGQKHPLQTLSARIFAPHFPQLKMHLVTTLSSIISSNHESFDASA